ncbi:hypothetical protein DFR70_10913 [Nocardia tenerifensis]|uniref:Uncharacterized protein n=1 Tax=Nocardia tenerifensis TaxID=228006 RepID=A0A318JZQ1_9NOCA|nr:hypothetical protein [Nocardia tenerifensis]PXX60822.1 hypothetical protein DFR70_10913 [Nocardia tenerifensis]
MNIRVEVERLVLQGLPISQADRARLLSAVETAITEQLTAPGEPWAPVAVAKVAAGQITLPDNKVGSLAAGIATATTRAIGHSGRGRP